VYAPRSSVRRSPTTNDRVRKCSVRDGEDQARLAAARTHRPDSGKVCADYRTLRSVAPPIAYEVPVPSLRSLCILALATLSGVTSGCVTSDDIHLQDTDRLTPSGRVSYEFWPGNAKRRSGTLVDLVRGTSTDATMQSIGIKPTISIDGAIAAVEGRDHQGVGTGHQINIGNQVLEGPTRVKLTARNLRGSLAARGGVRFYDVLSLEGITGLALDSTRVRARNAEAQATDEQFTPGLLLGARATVRPIALFDLYAQYTVSFTDEWKAIDDTEVGVELNVLRNLSVYGGYRWWSYSDEDFSFGSDWDIDIRGPTAGASLKF
jgi:opacity protein-like surface antigen